MDYFIDSHYFQLPSQGNIYTMTELAVANHPLKLLVASLKREIFCVEYQESSGGLIPTGKEVSFTYIPSGAEIVSIDAFNKSQTKNEFVIGITIIKNSNNLDSFEFYLNIYSEWEETDEFNIENVAQNCLNVELNFTPYHLTHTEVTVTNGNGDDESNTKEIVFLLSGSDNLVHVYREYSTDHLYKEVEAKEYFPEFVNKYPSPVVWMDIFINTNKSERFIATCCECGYVRLTKVCLKTRKLLLNFSTKFINYISSVKIFPKHDQAPQILKDVNLPTEDDIFNLIVVNTVLPPVLFENVTKYGLSKYSSLPRDDYNCILSCCQVADVDFDGEKEILIGNSAQELMLYKFDEERNSWCLEDLKILSSPLINLRYMDVIGDGVKELVVLAMRGVHFLQHDSAQVEEAISGKIEMLLSCLSIE